MMEPVSLQEEYATRYNNQKTIRTSFYTCLYLRHSSCEIDASIGLSSGLSVYNHLNLHIRKYTNSRACVRICNETRVDQFVVLLARLYIILSEVNMSVHISRNAQTNDAACVHTCTIFSTGEDTLHFKVLNFFGTWR